MAGDYDPNEGILGFQEYEGSLREENIDGEPRFFRSFYGPSTNRHDFLRLIFGAMVVDWGAESPCIELCKNVLHYPQTAWTCELDGPDLSVQPEFQMTPVSYRIEPWDRGRAHSLGTENTLTGGVVPQIDCGIVIEVEYRRCIQNWPVYMHDDSFVSTVNTGHDSFRSDVPLIVDPTCIDIAHEYGTEIRTLAGRTMEICTFGSATPAIAAGAAINDITADDLSPWTSVNTHIMTITLMNVPHVTFAMVRAILGKVNNDVWFGYPAHAVCCTEITPKLKCSVAQSLMYDIEYKFIARWVPSNGETLGMVMPSPGVSAGRFVHNGMVGVWNRGWWEHPIAVTTQHWWPVTEKGRSNPAGTEIWPADDRFPFEQTNFHNAFTWWADICP